MSTERDLGILLEEIVEHARSVVDATRGSIFLLDKDKNELWSKVAQGVREIRFPADKGDRKSTPSELQSRLHLVCRLLLEKKKKCTRLFRREEICHRRTPLDSAATPIE